MVIIITIIFVLSHHITNVIITIHINKVLVEDGRATGVEIDRFSDLMLKIWHSIYTLKGLGKG